MNEEIQSEELETIEEITSTPYTIETPFGDATTTIQVDPTTGEPIEGITKADFDSLIELLNEINSKTVTTTSDGSPLSMTYEQGQQIIDLLSTVLNWGMIVILVCAVVFIFRWVYKFFSGTIFGGL